MIYQPTDISPDEVNGSGAVDLTKNLSISWVPMGDSPMTAYSITIYKLDAASTELYSTGKMTLPKGIYGTDALGTAKRFAVSIHKSILAASDIVNGAEYKYLITCWSGDESVTQNAASIIRGRTTPVLTLDNLPSPLTAKSYTFTATHTQAEGDGLRLVRWRLVVAGSEDEPFYDSGEIRTPLLSMSYDGFVPGTDYEIRLNTVSSSGATADTGWQSFACEYEIEEASGSLTVLFSAFGGMELNWTAVDGASGYTIMRQLKDSGVMQNLGSVIADTIKVRDYTACAGKTYIWYVFPEGSTAYLNKPMVSEQKTVKYIGWQIIEATLAGSKIGSAATSSSTNRTVYTAENVHHFYGSITEGSVSNNNSPEILKNFTSYPTRLKSNANYRTGSLTALLSDTGGSIRNLYVSQRTNGVIPVESVEEELMTLSRSEKELFLLDPFGHCLRIATAGPITVSSDHSGALCKIFTFPWVETGSADGLSVMGLEP